MADLIGPFYVLHIVRSLPIPVPIHSVLYGSFSFIYDYKLYGTNATYFCILRLVKF